MDYRTDVPELLRQFLVYHETIRGHSKQTVDEYYLDLRTFFRFLKRERGLVPKDAPFDDISISDVDLALIRSVALSDVYDFLNYLSRERATQHNDPDASVGLSAVSRARKVASIRSFFKYLTVKAGVLEENPVLNIDSPKQKQTLPRYLTVEECLRLLESVDGPNRERDYCILTVFLNCGLRISELCGLNIPDIQGETLRVLGKGNKERILYINAATKAALDDHLRVRLGDVRVLPSHKNALFVTRQHRRITKAGVHDLIKKYLLKAGLDPDKYSAHKLRHTAATLMLGGGVDVRTLQELLGHEHLNTTQIYTHVASDDLRDAASANPLSRVKKRGRPKAAEPSALEDCAEDE
ncbi:tyrosine recombinase XerC [Oscillospiraceae bacterium OttesenSCG-928-G22]|nr:tyrosine recombinase XerC [Oscillospiraceae bacterium OttesenSCG-928-G22]